MAKFNNKLSKIIVIVLIAMLVAYTTSQLGLKAFNILVKRQMAAQFQRDMDAKGIKYSTNWFPGNILSWVPYSKDLGGRPNIKCLEIGSFEGLSTLWTAMNICSGDDSTVDAIDTWQGSIEHQNYAQIKNSSLYNIFSSNLASYINAGRVIPNKTSSYQALIDLNKKFLQNKQYQYDFIYIDGSHEAKDVMADAILAWPLLKVGGYLLFDDYQWQSGYSNKSLNEDPHSPYAAINLFLLAYEGDYKILYKGPQLHIQKINN
jgi:cephalosporin hydroxylase